MGLTSTESFRFIGEGVVAGIHTRECGLDESLDTGPLLPKMFQFSNNGLCIFLYYFYIMIFR